MNIEVSGHKIYLKIDIEGSLYIKSNRQFIKATKEEVERYNFITVDNDDDLIVDKETLKEAIKIAINAKNNRSEALSDLYNVIDILETEIACARRITSSLFPISFDREVQTEF